MPHLGKLAQLSLEAYMMRSEEDVVWQAMFGLNAETLRWCQCLKPGTEL